MDNQITIKYSIYQDGRADTKKVDVDVEVTPEVAAVLHGGEKKDHALLMQDIRNRNKQGYLEGETENLIADNRFDPVLDDVLGLIENEKLRIAFESLSEVQCRRMELYFTGLTFESIAVIEGVSWQSVQKSIKNSSKKIIRFFSKSSV